MEECDIKYIENVSNAERMCKENLNKFQRDLDDYAEMFKNRIQSELDMISNELKREFCKNSEMATDGWDQTLKSYKNVELEKVKNNFECTTENIERDADDEIRRFNLEFKERLKVISEDKLKEVTEQLQIALRDEIDLVVKKGPVDKNYSRDIKVSKRNEQKSKLYVERFAAEPREPHSAE